MFDFNEYGNKIRKQVIDSMNREEIKLIIDNLEGRIDAGIEKHITHWVKDESKVCIGMEMFSIHIKLSEDVDKYCIRSDGTLVMNPSLYNKYFKDKLKDLIGKYKVLEYFLETTTMFSPETSKTVTITIWLPKNQTFEISSISN